MIEFTIDAVKDSIIDDWFVYTDKYFQYKTLGIHREEEHSKGESGSVLKWLPFAIKQYEEKTGNHVDAFVVLQPTSPLRTSADIDNALLLYRAFHNYCSCLVSVVKEPSLKKFYNTDGIALSNQDAYHKQTDACLYKRNSAIFITDRNIFDETGKIFDEQPLLYIMPQSRSVDVDYQDDMALCETILKDRR